MSGPNFRFLWEIGRRNKGGYGKSATDIGETPPSRKGGVRSELKLSGVENPSNVSASRNVRFRGPMGWKRTWRAQSVVRLIWHTRKLLSWVMNTSRHFLYLFIFLLCCIMDKCVARQKVRHEQTQSHQKCFVKLSTDESRSWCSNASWMSAVVEKSRNHVEISNRV